MKRLFVLMIMVLQAESIQANVLNIDDYTKYSSTKRPVFSYNKNISSTSPADMCNNVLKDGVFNTITDSRHYNSDSENSSLYCSKDFEEYIDKRKTGADIGFTFKGIPFKFGFTNDNDGESRKLREVCDGKYSKVTVTDFKEYASKLASPDILNAWLKCIELLSTPNIVSFTSTLNGSIVTIRASFKGISGLAAPIVDELVAIGSVECKPTRMVKGATIPFEGITDFCMRKDKGEAVIILRTNLGDYSIQIARDRSGEVVGNYKVKINNDVKNRVSLGRMTKTFTTAARGPCNNAGCQQTPFMDIMTVDEPYFFMNAKIDSCVTGYGRPCTYPLSGGYHFEIKIHDALGDNTSKCFGNRMLRPQDVCVDGINGSLLGLYSVTYSAEKYRLDVDHQVKYTDPVEIRLGVEFTVTVPPSIGMLGYEKTSMIALVINNQAVEFDPRSFKAGYGIRKLREEVSPVSWNPDTFTFIADA